MSSDETLQNNSAKGWLSSAISPIFKAGHDTAQPVHDSKASGAGWRPKVISLPWMILLFILEMGIIGTIASLLVISNKRSGFVGLQDPPRFLLGHPLITKAI